MPWQPTKLPSQISPRPSPRRSLSRLVSLVPHQPRVISDQFHRTAVEYTAIIPATKDVPNPSSKNLIQHSHSKLASPRRTSRGLKNEKAIRIPSCVLGRSRGVSLTRQKRGIHVRGLGHSVTMELLTIPFIVISITAHRGWINAFLVAMGRPKYSLLNGGTLASSALYASFIHFHRCLGILPVLIKATAHG